MPQSKSATPWQNRIVGHEDVAVTTLVPHPKNWRQHSSTQTKALQAAIGDVGYIRSVTVNKTTGHIVDGHLRVELARATKQTTIPVEYVELTPEEEAEALLLVDPIAALAGTDADKLQALLDEVHTDSTALDSMLRDMADAAGVLYGTSGVPIQDVEPEIDRAEELRQQYGVELGQLWALGDHRLLCGDSTDKVAVDRVLGGSKPVLMVTDPPYGIEYDATWRGEAGVNTMGATAAHDIAWDGNADWTPAYKHSGADVAFVFHASIHTRIVADSLESAGYDVSQQIIWLKSVPALTRSHYHFKHEPCWYAVRKGATAHWQGSTTATTIWEAASPLHIMGGSTEEKYSIVGVGAEIAFGGRGSKCGCV